MASLEKYRACIQRLLTERALKGGDQWVEAQTDLPPFVFGYLIIYQQVA
jgi:hypothetical protein